MKIKKIDTNPAQITCTLKPKNGQGNKIRVFRITGGDGQLIGLMARDTPFKAQHGRAKIKKAIRNQRTKRQKEVDRVD